MTGRFASKRHIINFSNGQSFYWSSNISLIKYNVPQLNYYSRILLHLTVILRVAFLLIYINTSTSLDTCWIHKTTFKTSRALELPPPKDNTSSVSVYSLQVHTDLC